jgi:S-adenosylmethionine synthetase
MVFGEIGGAEKPDVESIVHDTLATIGYNADTGWDTTDLEIIDRIIEQSPEIDGGVSRDDAEDILDSIGAGDQGMMVGYATTETPERLPLPFVLAHRITAGLEQARWDGVLPWLRPDGKAEVTIRYDDGEPSIDTVLVSVQHDETVTLDDVRNGVIGSVINPVINEYPHDGVKILVNPCGTWHIGGPLADSGLTGRKLGVDKYGGLAFDGGGALCGKDPSKVDRSGAYAARWIAKTIVDAGLADKVQVQVAYAIGVAEPVSVDVDTLGTGADDDRLTGAVRKVFDLRPAAIIRDLSLDSPWYAGIGAHGHFGDTKYSWENPTRIPELIAAYGE